MEKEFFEDYQVGETFVSPGRTITESDIVLFAAITGDWHELHTNVEYAKTTHFKERIAHGMLSLVIGSALMFRLGAYVMLPKSFVAFYGMDDIRFINPLRIGDTIWGQVEVKELNEKDDKLGILVEGLTVVNQKKEVVLQANIKSLCAKNKGF